MYDLPSALRPVTMRRIRPAGIGVWPLASPGAAKRPTNAADAVAEYASIARRSILVFIVHPSTKAVSTTDVRRQIVNRLARGHLRQPLVCRFVGLNPIGIE